MLIKLVLQIPILKSLSGEIAVFLKRCGLLPKTYHNLADRWHGSRCFRNAKLQWSPNSYWELNPMPNQSELMKFYNNTFQPSEYWDFKEKTISADLRDFDHTKLLKETYPDDIKGMRFLNFGSGAGGISFILHLMGADVTNVEPSIMEDFGWKHSYDLSEVHGTFDIIYSSHSLEHVTSVKATMANFDSLMNKGSYLFIEVPNCRQSNRTRSENGGQDGKIYSPHTIYFTLDFFRSLPYEHILLSTFNGGISEETIPTIADHEDGNVIRYIGRKN